MMRKFSAIALSGSLVFSALPAALAEEDTSDSDTTTMEEMTEEKSDNPCADLRGLTQANCMRRHRAEKLRDIASKQSDRAQCLALTGLEQGQCLRRLAGSMHKQGTTQRTPALLRSSNTTLEELRRTGHPNARARILRAASRRSDRLQAAKERQIGRVRASVRRTQTELQRTLDTQGQNRAFTRSRRTIRDAAKARARARRVTEKLTDQ